MVMMMTFLEEIPHLFTCGTFIYASSHSLDNSIVVLVRSNRLSLRLCDDTKFHTAERAYGVGAASCTKPAHTTQVVRIKR